MVFFWKAEWKEHYMQRFGFGEITHFSVAVVSEAPKTGTS